MSERVADPSRPDPILGLSSHAIDEFTDHPVWKVVMFDLKVRLKDTRDKLEKAPLEDVIIDGSLIQGVKFWQGACDELRYMRNILQTMKTDLESKRREKKDD